MPWSEKSLMRERVAWIEVAGVPLHCWNHETFRRVAALWGSLISMGDDWMNTASFEKAELLITINQPYQVEDLLLMEVGDGCFSIRIKEKGLSEMEKVEIRKNRGQSEEKEGESPVDRSETNSNLILLPEDRPNIIEGTFNVISIKDGAKEKECQNMSVVSLAKESNSNSSKGLELLDEDDGCMLVDRAKEDLIYMGLLPQDDPNVGPE